MFSGSSKGPKTKKHRRDTCPVFPPLIAERILYASRYKSFSMSLPMVEGGEPINEETAVSLKATLFGDCCLTVPTEWIKAHFEFNEPTSPFSYGLMIPKNGTKAALICIQAFVLKNLLFKHANSNRRRKKDNQPDTLRVTVQQQNDALVGAIADIIWKCAQETGRACLCLPADEIYLEKSQDFSLDGVTERIQMFYIEEFPELTDMVNKYIHLFQQEDSSGLLVVLYSMLLSRGTDRVLEDMDGEQSQLIPGVGDSIVPLLSLYLTGRASPFLHNGTVMVADCDQIPRPKTGVCERCDTGLLIWWSNKDLRREVGSRMKTPLCPIWVTCVDDHYGLLFNPNQELMRDHRAEHCFDLHYYNSSTSQTEPCVLNLDTRFSNSKEEYELPLLDRLVMTKWQEVAVNWNGTTPFV